MWELPFEVLEVGFFLGTPPLGTPEGPSGAISKLCPVKLPSFCEDRAMQNSLQVQWINCLNCL